MQQFQVPQFIRVEDKIFGPLTLKQFLFLLAGGFIIFLLRATGIPTFLLLIFGALIAGFFTALAFLKVNGESFYVIVMGGLKFNMGAKLFLWDRTQKKATPKATALLTPNIEITRAKFRLTDSKLKELAWSLDIQRDHDR